MGGSGKGSLQWFKRAQTGLYGGRQRLTGNSVSPSKSKVRRVWLPNVQRHGLWSDILQRKISINVTNHALRHIDRVGGVDNYLLFAREEVIASRAGMRLKDVLLERLRAEAKERRDADAAGSGGAAERAAATPGPTTELR